VFPSLDVSALLLYFAMAHYYIHSGAHIRKRPQPGHSVHMSRCRQYK